MSNPMLNTSQYCRLNSIHLAGEYVREQSSGNLVKCVMHFVLDFSDLSETQSQLGGVGHCFAWHVQVSFGFYFNF